MADYNKQTVAQLRQLLKDRGIPSTGLTRKAQIIEELEKADDSSPGAFGASNTTGDAAPSTEEPEWTEEQSAHEDTVPEVPLVEAGGI